jgi:hypothetical protein
MNSPPVCQFPARDGQPQGFLGAINVEYNSIYDYNKKKTDAG